MPSKEVKTIYSIGVDGPVKPDLSFPHDKKEYTDKKDAEIAHIIPKIDALLDREEKLIAQRANLKSTEPKHVPNTPGVHILAQHSKDGAPTKEV